MNVELITASIRDQGVLENLLELYAYDLSDVFQLDVGENGRFGYAKLPLYWSEPDRRFPFLIRTDGRLAGFALVARGSPASDDPNTWDLAEFFVMRRYRRSGAGTRAASLVWDRFPGNWTVRVSSGNKGGCAFWPRVIDAYTSSRFVESLREGKPHPWRIFSFASAIS